MSEEVISPRKVLVQEKTNNLTLELTGGAVFGALSVAVSFLASYLPRTPWGAAYVDPVSWLWIICFLIFGFRSGMICVIIGFLGLIPFDPNGVLGPSFKVLATIWHILIPYLYMKWNRKIKVSASTLQDKKHFVLSNSMAFVARVIVMVLFNIVAVLYIYNIEFYFLSFPLFGLDSLSMGTFAIIVVLLNLLQTITDMVVPYLLVFQSGISEKYKLW